MAYSKPRLRARIKRDVLASSKGGAPGQWSARKAQLVAQQYEQAGGGYIGPKRERQRSLTRWTREDWGTRSGKPSTEGPDATGERYLPRKVRNRLTASEYAATSRKKRADSRKGMQFSPQPQRIADKTARARRRLT